LCRLAGVDPREYLADVLPRLTSRIRLVDRGVEAGPVRPLAGRPRADRARGIDTTTSGGRLIFQHPPAHAAQLELDRERPRPIPEHEVSGDLGAADLQVIAAAEAEATYPNGRQPCGKLR
jgi:hypothetical protein